MLFIGKPKGRSMMISKSPEYLESIIDWDSEKDNVKNENDLFHHVKGKVPAPPEMHAGNSGPKLQNSSGRHVKGKCRKTAARV